MKNGIQVGLGRYLIPLPPIIWHRVISSTAQKEMARLASVRSGAHRRVHDFVVRELPRVGEPLWPELIGQTLAMPVDRVNALLADLEKKLVLFRYEHGAVVWAYPATADTTPHHLTFSTGEQGYAA